MFAETIFEEAAIPLERGDILILYSDGINEASNIAGEQFGMERLINVVLQHGAESLQGLQEAILRNVTNFSEGQSQQDDITVLLVRV